MTRTLALVALALSLASCHAPNYANRCAGYGFSPGTDAYASCVQQETLAQNRRTFDYMQSLDFGQPAPRPVTW